MIGAWIEYISPLIVCLIAGLLYGYSFLLQQRSWFRGGYSLRGRIIQITFFIARIVILLATVKYLLRSGFIPSILGIVVFIALFWLVILSAKVFQNGRNWHRRE